MEENVRNWLWFFSVVLAMTVGPVLLGTLVICGTMQAYRRYHAMAADKLRDVGRAAASALQVPAKSQYSRQS